jgi:phosphoenolpyruvate-protein kinase (PTS system EI component)
MEPGSILVCPTTTPAWTPLFAQARGLVTDVGGILAHGSIVAREYGIPAVMGTGRATQWIAHGQTITGDSDELGAPTRSKTSRTWSCQVLGVGHHDSAVAWIKTGPACSTRPPGALRVGRRSAPATGVEAG